MGIKFKIDKLPEKFKGLFIADGGEKYPGPERSLWFDKEESDRSFRDVCQNIWMSPAGAADQYFDQVVNEKIRIKCKQPQYQGEIYFTERSISFLGCKIDKVKFQRDFGRKNLKWFGSLENTKDGLKPTQFHNYIVCCDIGFGSGASNSSAEFYDCNTGENVGEYVCSNKTPEEFADYIVAICNWIGGARLPLLNFDNTGGQGGLFCKRILSRGYSNIYSQTTELNKTRKRQNKYGFCFNNRQQKDYVLNLLKAALKEGLKDKPTQSFIKVYNENIVEELDGYIFYDSGEIASSEDIDTTTAARARHGDRVIALALCVLSIQDMGKAEKAMENNPPVGSLAWRMLQDKLAEQRKSQGGWQEPKRKIRTNWQ